MSRISGWWRCSLMLLLCAIVTANAAPATEANPTPQKLAERYTKYEYRIPMRDGVRLFTVVYVPKDASKSYPFLMLRTPYSVGTRAGDEKRYGEDRYPSGSIANLGPSADFDDAGYIFVFQDVRGRFMSEGHWLEMTPARDEKRSGADVDESSDMHDSVDWLLKHIPNNNGRVGIWGISYPGFYTSASIIDSHPAIRAASPQAPVTDLYMGDDAYHGGTYQLAANFGFYAVFKPQANPTDEPRKWDDYDYGTTSGYDFFLQHGTLPDVAKLFAPQDRNLWDDQYLHTNYDDYWKSRNIAAHLKNIHCAVLTVGGWYDAEDLQGPLTTYHRIGANNPGIFNALVMGPWVHGGWERTPGHRLGAIDFGADTSDYYQKHILFPFFEHYLKNTADPKLAEANVFETGTNVWRRYPSWPPKQVQPRELYFQKDGALSWTAPATPGSGEAFDEYRSDPQHPVPFIGYAATDMPQEYMISDQRFAATRNDVQVYQTAPLEQDVTLAGPIDAKLFVSTSGTDSDIVVKLIDVYPQDYPDAASDSDDEDKPKDVQPPHTPLGGYQQLVRGEPLRGKFRHGFETPMPFVPNQVEALDFTLPDINHSFRRGHRIMVQVQSSWFPLDDRNPQVFEDIATARPEDFKPATERIYRQGSQSSGLIVPVLNAGAGEAQ